MIWTDLSFIHLNLSSQTVLIFYTKYSGTPLLHRHSVDAVYCRLSIPHSLVLTEANNLLWPLLNLEIAVFTPCRWDIVRSHNGYVYEVFISTGSHTKIVKEDTNKNVTTMNDISRSGTACIYDRRQLKIHKESTKNANYELMLSVKYLSYIPWWTTTCVDLIRRSRLYRTEALHDVILIFY